MDADRIAELNRETREIWDQNAEWWDERVGAEGPILQRSIIGPTSERLLDLQPGELVLDIACGNGAFSRRMADLGARVVASDFSEKFIARARERSVDYGDRIQYSVVDATDYDQLMVLGEGRYDAAVCTMAMMDMVEIDTMLRALARLLKPSGRFVFSVTHPCFNHTGMSRVAEEVDRGGEIVQTYGVKIVRYASNGGVAKGLGIIGQPVAQNYFDRTLSTTLNSCFRAGFVLDGIEEPAFLSETKPERAFSWGNFNEIPPVLLARLRIAR